ncbi:MAG: hypothetical protein JWM19_423 [Actinomycetia bacterium]|nr:hypothetical protein [Actinomycetes bacterium]
MARTALRVLAAASAVAGLALVPGVASAATAAGPAGPAAIANSSTPSGGDPNTTVTFTVTVGGLSMTAPAAADLGSGAPGSTISGPLGTVAVADARALASAAWTVTASSTDWTSGTSTIPAGDVNYDPGFIHPTGTVTTTGSDITLSGTPQTIVTGTAGSGDNTASWIPTISVVVPGSAVGGLYTGTLTQSVS